MKLSKVKWEFNAEVADVFDSMLDRSIPNHRAMRQAIRPFLLSDRVYLDLGSSRGWQVQEVLQCNPAMVYAVEESPAMCAVLRERFSDDGRVTIVEKALQDVSLPTCDVTLSVLTLQFLPLNQRQELISRVHRALSDGGQFIVVEKVIGESFAQSWGMSNEYHLWKHEVGGYTWAEIEEKAQQLVGVMTPLSESMNVQMLENEGFEVEEFWRALCFRGWLCRKN